MTEKLVIGVDIRDLHIAKTGTGTYLKELCKEFRKMEDPAVKFYFFDTSFAVYTGEFKLFKIAEHIRLQIWKQIILPLKAWSTGCDILFCTDNIVPLIQIGYKTIPVIHDAFFFENPEHYNRLWLWMYKNLAVPAAKKSVFVITPTNYATERIHYYTGIKLPKLITVYEGPKSLEIPKITLAGNQVLPEFDFTPSNYVLHVGIMDKRKNIPALIYAFKLLLDNGYAGKLVLVGKADSVKLNNDSEAIKTAILDTGLVKEIVITGYLSDYELAKVYSAASLYVFPSLNEGFGIPILEAFKYRLPVLVANNTCLPEVGGDAVLTFDPQDINDIFEKMMLVIKNKEIRLEMINKGSLRLKDFSWEKAALQLVTIFKQAKNSN